jgi:hypothetical protein
MTDGVADVLSYGGGRQTVALCLLVAKGLQARPDRVVIADTGREKRSTWDYLDAHVRPLLRSIGLEVEVAPHGLATVDLYAKNGDMLVPAYTATGKLKPFCSNEWKAQVIRRHLRATGVERARCWIGYAVDESGRINDDRRYARERLDDPDRFGPWTRTYPLCDLMLTKADCRRIVEDFGWPLPAPSACYMCPHLGDAEWRHVRDELPDQFAEACRLDEALRAEDVARGGSGVWLHRSLRPLREADLDRPGRAPAPGQCGLGGCFT